MQISLIIAPIPRKSFKRVEAMQWILDTESVHDGSNDDEASPIGHAKLGKESMLRSGLERDLQEF